MRPRAGMNLAGGGGRVDEVEGARSCEARPGCSAASSESAIGERVLGPCIDSSMAKSRPVLSSSRRWLLPCVVGVVVVWRLVFGSRRWFAKRAVRKAVEPMLHQADRLRQYGSPTAPAPRWISQSCRGGPKPATGEFIAFLATRGSSCPSCHSQTVAPAQLVP